MKKTILAPITMVILAIVVSTIAVAAEKPLALEGYSRVVTLSVSGYTFVVALNISCSYNPSSAMLTIHSQALLAYSSSPNATLFLVADVVYRNETIASLVYGELSPLKPSSKAVVVVRVQPPLPRTLTLVFRGFVGSKYSTAVVTIPFPEAWQKPSLSIQAFFENGLPYTIVPLGLKGYERAYIYVSNTGSAVAHNTIVKVLVDGRLASIYAIGDIAPGGGRGLRILVPIPPTAGLHLVSIVAECSEGLKTSITLRVYVAKPPTVILELLNKTTVFYAGDRVCFKLATVGLSGDRALIALEYSTDNGRSWSQLWATVVTGKSSYSTLYCVEASPTGRILYRGLVSVYYHGVSFNATSTPIAITVEPSSSMLAGRRIVLEVNPAHAYLVELISFDVHVIPPLTHCVKAAVEVMQPKTFYWKPIEVTTLCGSGSTITIPASSLGEGSHWVRVEAFAGPYRFASNNVLVVVYGKPRLLVTVKPSIVSVGASIKVNASLVPLVKRTILASIQPSWSPPINTTMPNGRLSLRLEAPSKPGDYSVKVVVRLSGVTLSSTASIRVVKPTPTLILQPSTVTSGATFTATVKLSPPASDYAIIAIVSPKGEKLYTTSLVVLNGVGSIQLKAPKEPGAYKVTVWLQRLKTNTTAVLVVKKIKYSLKLTVSPLKATPGSQLTATITITPKPSKPVTITLLEKINNTWKPVASTITLQQVATLTFKAPGKPGTYVLQAACKALNTTSNTVTVVVQAMPKAAKQIIPFKTLMMVIGGVIAVGALGSVLAVRRR